MDSLAWQLQASSFRSQWPCFTSWSRSSGASASCKSSALSAAKRLSKAQAPEIHPNDVNFSHFLINSKAIFEHFLVQSLKFFAKKVVKNCETLGRHGTGTQDLGLRVLKAAKLDSI